MFFLFSFCIVLHVQLYECKFNCTFSRFASDNRNVFPCGLKIVEIVKTSYKLSFANFCQCPSRFIKKKYQFQPHNQRRNDLLVQITDFISFINVCMYMIVYNFNMNFNWFVLIFVKLVKFLVCTNIFFFIHGNLFY